MKLFFHKMTGAGNDFIMVDNRDLSLSHVLMRDCIARLCNRRFGIGADGLIAVEPAQAGGDVRMRYYNADGGEAAMCGNGARCFTAFVNRLTGGSKTTLHFETLAGIVDGAMQDNGEVAVQLTPPRDMRLNVLHPTKELPAPVHFINTGVPHAVVYLQSVDETDVVKLGRYLRCHPAFAPAGTNVDFAAVSAPNHLKIRTYERGVEDETLACGTGITAAALLHACLTGAASPIALDTAGGCTLHVAFEQTPGGDFKHVTLTGPAVFVYQGETEL